MKYCLNILPICRYAKKYDSPMEEIDLENAVWTFGKRNEHDGGMKMRVAHTVPLARQVVDLFRELRNIQEMNGGRVAFQAHARPAERTQPKACLAFA